MDIWGFIEAFSRIVLKLSLVPAGSDNANYPWTNAELLALPLFIKMEASIVKLIGKNVNNSMFL